MLWLKSFHIFFVVAWFVGLFYLPRLFVNYVEAGTAAGEILLGMARRLLRFMHIPATLAILSGIFLWKMYGFSGGWLHLKLACVVALVIYQFFCARLLRALAAGENRYSAKWYRAFNELPTFFLISIIVLVVVKPF
jgi:putative membrane protein